MWSLGIILVNLTCGRNPWKRASIEDSTFRAHLNDPKFLSSILPLSPELNTILRRTFELDPRRRITIPELRNLILRCPRFTNSCSAVLSAPPSPPSEAQYFSYSVFKAVPDSSNPFHRYPAMLYPPTPPIHSIAAQYSQLSISSNGSSSSDDGSVYSASSTCSDSSDTYQTLPTLEAYLPPKLPDNYYGTFIPLDSGHKDPLLSHTRGVHIASF